MATIRVTPDELENISAQFRQVAAEQEVVTQKTLALLNTLNGAWQGETVTEYSKRLTFMVNSAQAKAQLMRLLADEISKVGEQMISCDTDMASQIAKQFMS